MSFILCINHLIIYHLVNIISPAPNRRWHKSMMLSDVCLSDVCLTYVCLTSVAYIGPKSRTERPRKTKIRREVAHVTRDSDTPFKIKRLKVQITRPLYSPPCWRVKQLQRWAWERVGRGKLLLRCRLLGGARRFGACGGKKEAGHIVAAARLQLVLSVFSKCICIVSVTCRLLEQYDT